MKRRATKLGCQPVYPFLRSIPKARNPLSQAFSHSTNPYWQACIMQVYLGGLLLFPAPYFFDPHSHYPLPSINNAVWPRWLRWHPWSRAGPRRSRSRSARTRGTVDGPMEPIRPSYRNSTVRRWMRSMPNMAVRGTSCSCCPTFRFLCLCPCHSPWDTWRRIPYPGLDRQRKFPCKAWIKAAWNPFWIWQQQIPPWSCRSWWEQATCWMWR